MEERADVPEGAGVAEKKVDFVPHLCQKEVIQFIDKNKEKPFFLYYALNIPHANNEGGSKGMEVPSYGEFADMDWPDAEKGFAAMISYIDGYVEGDIRQTERDRAGQEHAGDIHQRQRSAPGRRAQDGVLRFQRTTPRQETGSL